MGRIADQVGQGLCWLATYGGAATAMRCHDPAAIRIAGYVLLAIVAILLLMQLLRRYL